LKHGGAHNFCGDVSEGLGCGLRDTFDTSEDVLEESGGIDSAVMEALWIVVQGIGSPRLICTVRVKGYKGPGVVALKFQSLRVLGGHVSIALLGVLCSLRIVHGN
jgi:hypothetical protein